LAAGDVILNGVSVGASTSTSAFAAAAQDGSALAKAAAINAGTSEHGVTATAGTTTVVGAGGSLSNTNTETGTFTINGVSTGEITAGASDAATLTATRTAINAITGATGVSAKNNAGGDGIDLESTSGQNIYVTYATGTGTPTADAFGIDVADLSTVHTGALSYVSTSSQGIAFTGSSLGKIGSSVDQAAAVDPASTGNVLTSANAEAMLTQVDSALDSVSDTRAALGATQNRFSSVVANLQTASENLSASRSRIMDADFAAETAQMTKAQILQQSGIAMLAQANSVPQNVLALLQ
jgi:flagellin